MYIYVCTDVHKPEICIVAAAMRISCLCTSVHTFFGLCTYVHTYIYTYVHTYMYTYIYTYIYIHVYVYVCVCMYTQAAMQRKLQQQQLRADARRAKEEALNLLALLVQEHLLY
jgi:hypothetical protein